MIDISKFFCDSVRFRDSYPIDVSRLNFNILCLSRGWNGWCELNPVLPFGLSDSWALADFFDNVIRGLNECR
jgi:hypothetical protein